MIPQVFLTRNVALTSLFIISIAGYTREEIIHGSLHHHRFLKLCNDKFENAADWSLRCGVSSVLCGSAFTDNGFASLVLTPELCLFSIACHLLWTHMSSSVSPFFQILWIAWISNYRLLTINSALFYIEKHYCFISSIQYLYFRLIQSLWNALLVLIPSYPAKLCPVHLVNFEMMHQLVSFTFRNFCCLLSSLSHSSSQALAANSAFKSF